MAKRTRAESTAAGNMGAGSSRGSGRKAGGNARRRRSRRSAKARGSQDDRMRGAERGESEGGMMSGARGIAQSLGQSTARTARQFASTARDAATGVASRTQETVGQAVEKVRDNPWPALLIGAGVTWLAVGAIRGRSEDEPAPHARRGRRRRSDAAGIVSRTASTLADAGRGAGEYVGDFVRERPILAGAATLGIGVAVGMAMPSTSAENAMLGDARDTVVRRAKDVARGTMDSVRGMADTIEWTGSR
jgi:ElaB/YqjD/DUF883 family membrane-anchored ribosome-binding protein